VAVDIGPDGRLYALEFSPAAGYPTPGVGKVVRIDWDGTIEDVATGLTVPTGMTFGPDGDLYVSDFGAAPPGAGQIVRISVR
jgi:sugar lactone lactonase YvrE